MARYLARRLVQLLFVTLWVSTLLFILLRLSGDPVLLLVGQFATEEMILKTREALGLNRPVIVQYFVFLKSLYTLDFGISLQTKLPIMEVMGDRLRASLQLALASISVALVLSVPIGIFAAMRRGSMRSSLLMAAALVGQGMPNFWLGLLLILIFSVRLGWFPSIGYGSATHLVLPAVTLAAFLTAKMTRFIRSEMLNVLDQDFIRTAHSKGLPSTVVTRRHALSNALIPVLTVLGMELGQLMGGAVIVESIFRWPGMGQWLIQGVGNRDYPVVQAGIFVVAIGVVLVNFIVDLAYSVLDPRIGKD